MTNKHSAKSFNKIDLSAKKSKSFNKNRLLIDKTIEEKAITNTQHNESKSNNENLQNNCIFNTSEVMKTNLSNFCTLSLKTLNRHQEIMIDNFHENLKLTQQLVQPYDPNNHSVIAQKLFQINFSSVMDILINANSLLHVIYLNKTNSVLTK